MYLFPKIGAAALLLSAALAAGALAASPGSTGCGTAAHKTDGEGGTTATANGKQKTDGEDGTTATDHGLQKTESEGGTTRLAQQGTAGPCP